MNRIIFSLFIIALSGAAVASNQQGKVIDIRVSSTTVGGNPTHIRLDGAWNGKQPCATQPYWAIDTDTELGKNILSVVLLAYASGKTVQIFGTDQCTLRADMENAFQIALPQQ